MALCGRFGWWAYFRGGRLGGFGPFVRSSAPCRCLGHGWAPPGTQSGTQPIGDKHSSPRQGRTTVRSSNLSRTQSRSCCGEAWPRDSRTTHDVRPWVLNVPLYHVRRCSARRWRTDRMTDQDVVGGAYSWPSEWTGGITNERCTATVRAR